MNVVNHIAQLFALDHTQGVIPSVRTHRHHRDKYLSCQSVSGRRNVAALLDKGGLHPLETKGSAIVELLIEVLEEQSISRYTFIIPVCSSGKTDAEG